MKIRKVLCAIAGCFFILGMAVPGFPEEPEEQDFGSSSFDTNQLIDALAPSSSPSPSPSGYKGRSIRPVEKEKPKAISMEITFEKNSYKLTADARKKLDVVGQAFNSDRLGEFRFVVEGHTDASGDENYNLKLSRQRASEVRRYLTRYHNVDPARLEAEGKGEYDLLLKDDPTNGRNRRVRIVNMGN